VEEDLLLLVGAVDRIDSTVCLGYTQGGQGPTILIFKYNRDACCFSFEIVQPRLATPKLSTTYSCSYSTVVVLMDRSKTTLYLLVGDDTNKSVSIVKLNLITSCYCGIWTCCD
jgi:hypothetical protein